MESEEGEIRGGASRDHESRYRSGGKGASRRWIAGEDGFPGAAPLHWATQGIEDWGGPLYGARIKGCCSSDSGSPRRFHIETLPGNLCRYYGGIRFFRVVPGTWATDRPKMGYGWATIGQSCKLMASGLSWRNKWRSRHAAIPKVAGVPLSGGETAPYIGIDSIWIHRIMRHLLRRQARSSVG